MASTPCRRPGLAAGLCVSLALVLSLAIAVLGPLGAGGWQTGSAEVVAGQGGSQPDGGAEGAASGQGEDGVGSGDAAQDGEGQNDAGSGGEGSDGESQNDAGSDGAGQGSSLLGGGLSLGSDASSLAEALDGFPASCERRELAEDVSAGAREVLEAYEEQGDVVLVHAGWADLLAQSWACVVSGPGWVEICLVSETGEQACRVETARMEVEAWERAYLGE